MPGRLSRRDSILEAASELFIRQGYHATTVRQIAEAVTASDAAIYYHFKDGKRELLKEVVGLAEIDLRAALKHLDGAASLNDLTVRYGAELEQIWKGRIHRTLRWLVCEVPHLSRDEQVTFYAALLGFQEQLEARIHPFVSDPARAKNIAWLLICTSFGYRQVFFDLEVDAMIELKVTSLFTLIAEGLATS